MSTYVNGGRYLRHRDTGAVFNYNEALATNVNLVLMEANEAGELTAVAPKAQPSSQLAPAKTPEKKEAPASERSANKQVTKPPTLSPANR